MRAQQPPAATAAVAKKFRIVGCFRLGNLKGPEMDAINRQATMVTDILPWPSGQGFEGSSEWWSHVKQQRERKRIDQLLGSALLSGVIRQKLVEDRDETLLDAFGLSEDTKTLIRSIEATSISELATAIVSSYSPLV
jgi:hypothetical protein